MLVMHVLFECFNMFVAEPARPFCCWLHIFWLLMPVSVGHKISLFSHAIFGVVGLYMFC